MTGSEHHAGGDDDLQICNVYGREALVVQTGVNAGETVAGAGDSFPGDTYVFSSDAQAGDLLVPEKGDAGTHDQTHDLGPDSEAGIGVLGRDVNLDSRLTFMGEDGRTVEVLMLAGEGDQPGWFLPLTPLVPDMEYTLIKADEDPGSFSYSDYTCVCFARGTLIRMADGSEKPVETLVEGDMVQTRDNGPQPVRWVGGRVAPAHGHLAPIVITSGALGNHSDLIVSPQHRLLIADWRAEVMLGSHEVLVKARDLVNDDTIYRREGGVVEYFHILFDNHEIIYSEGIPSESLHINRTTLDSLAEESRAEIIELFPEIEERPQVSAVASRMSLKSYEAVALLRQVGFR